MANMIQRIIILVAILQVGLISGLTRSFGLREKGDVLLEEIKVEVYWSLLFNGAQYMETLVCFEFSRLLHFHFNNDNYCRNTIQQSTA